MISDQRKKIIRGMLMMLLAAEHAKEGAEQTMTTFDVDK